MMPLFMPFAAKIWGFLCGVDSNGTHCTSEGAGKPVGAPLHMNLANRSPVSGQTRTHKQVITPRQDAHAQRQPPTLPSSHLRFLSALKKADFLFSLTRLTNSPISRSDAIPLSSSQLSSSPLTSCSCSCTLALSLWYNAIGLNDWSASSVSESFERCCCSKARNESKRDCDCSRCWFSRASSCRRESASARLLSIRG